MLFRAGLTEFPCVVGAQWPLQTGNALTTIPAGVMSPNEELVYIDGANFGRIRLAEATTPYVDFIRELVPPDRYASGDLVYLARGAMVATMAGRSCGEHSDCLIEFDPRTGALQKDYGPIGVSEVYGLTEYQGTLYGFTGAAQVLQIAFIDGTVRVTEIATTGAPADGFTGATLSHP